MFISSYVQSIFSVPLASLFEVCSHTGERYVVSVLAEASTFGLKHLCVLTVTHLTGERFSQAIFPTLASKEQASSTWQHAYKGSCDSSLARSEGFDILGLSALR
jgi:hypothetical protein